MNPFQDKQRGCLLGLAIGDALGAAVEFQQPGTFAPVTGYRGGGPHGLNPGEWTDDTSMALALADSIAHAGWDLNDQAGRYVSWWQQGEYSVNGRCFDIGITTRSALARFQKHHDANSSGDSSERASGNGSIMRLAPVPIHFVEDFAGRIEQLAMRAVESSLPTHASPQCLSACRYFAIVLAGLMQGLDRDAVLSTDWEPLEKLRAIEPLHHEIDAVAAGSFRNLRPPAIRGSGYVVKSLEAALWAFCDAKDYREAVLKAVNLGDDADTTGAVCGQLAGAYWGETGIPQEWRDELRRADLIESALTGLLDSKRAAQSVRPTSSVGPSVASEDPPTNSSYWADPGRLLAGPYPGAVSPDKHRKKVQELVDADVRVFVNLMEPNEVNHLRQKFAPYENVARELASDVTCVRFPIHDGSIPSVREMVTILDAIDGYLDAGRVVYVHCWGGVGRTGTVISCWLIRHHRATTDSAIATLAELRKQDRERGGRDSPETPPQIAFVKNWTE
ncbi:MAG: ADP-ribosylglycohydrolase family protein [Planctomycetota bacterium]|nr:ADP-ribosylglycohydrolase family protein [Planctomycetota bacterium]